MSNFLIDTFIDYLKFLIADAQKASQVYGARRRTSSTPEVCTIRHFPAGWDSLPRTTVSDNRAGPFDLSRHFSTLTVYLEHMRIKIVGEGQRATKKREGERKLNKYGKRRIETRILKTRSQTNDWRIDRRKGRNNEFRYRRSRALGRVLYIL